MVSYGSNLPGGIFLPILTLGAIIGTLYGSLLVQYVGWIQFCEKLLILPWLVILLRLVKHR